MGAPQFVVICVMLWTCCTERVQSVRKQKDAVQAVRRSVGLVFYDYQLGEPGTLIRNPRPPAPAVLIDLLGVDFFATPVEVSLGNGGIRRVSVLTQLRCLNVSFPIKDADLVHIEGLTKLQDLDLGGCPITDAGLAHLKALTQLQYLGIWSTNVSDGGLQHLNTLTQLRWLNLSHTQVTDAGLERLRGLKQLQSLNVEHTRVTPDGVARLRQALPNCRIEK